MENIDTPRVDTGQVFIREGVIVWFRRGQWLFLFLVIIALVITFPLPEPNHDWQGPERQPFVEAAVNGPSSVAEIMVTATPNYNGSN